MYSDLDPDPYLKGPGHNNFYILLSNSWPVEVYNFGEAKRTSQVERTIKMF